MKFKIFWAWFDFWVGFYYDRRKDILYFCPLPTVVLAFSFRDIEIPTAEYDGTQKKMTVECTELRREG
jgi:hypothetical protein